MVFYFFIYLAATLNLIKEFASNEHNNQNSLLDLVCTQIFKCVPNYEYLEEKPNSFICKANIKAVPISEGKSNMNKKLARKEAVKLALEKLVPSLYLEKELKEKEKMDIDMNLTITDIPYISPTNSPVTSNLNNDYLNKKRKKSDSKEYEVLSGGSLQDIEKKYEDLKISDREVVEQYLSSTCFSPSKVYNIFILRFYTF
jgi:hypothetical protein